MFYIVNTQRPYTEYVLGTVEFQRIIREYLIDIGELTHNQYQTFKGMLYAHDLIKDLVPSNWSHYVVRYK